MKMIIMRVAKRRGHSIQKLARRCAILSTTRHSIVKALVVLGGIYIFIASHYTYKYKLNNHYYASQLFGLTPTPTIHSTQSNRTQLQKSDAFCRRIKTALDIASWPDVIYHKDRRDNEYPSGYFDSGYVASMEEDDAQARATIHEFNKFRSSVLTPQLLKEGFRPGRIYPIRRFADRVRLLVDSVRSVGNSEEQSQQHPLIIAVFGTSFTIGSNCGESTAQGGDDCAWPLRLARRFNEILVPDNHTWIEWKMYQENAQGSVNIAQKIPSIIDEFQQRNATPDVVLLDNSISDAHSDRPWFEAVVRAFIKHFPGTVLVSIVDGIPRFVSNPENLGNSWLYRVQKHYGLAVIDFAQMVRLQRHNTGQSDYIMKSINTDNFARENENDDKSTPIDLLWPQAHYMKHANGTIVYDDDTDYGEIYWANLLPMTRKTKLANYPENHPPWVTHQYVADGIMYGLLNLVKIGLGCDSFDYDKSQDNSSVSSFSSLETSVATMEEINPAFICETPVTRIDAKSPSFAGRTIDNYPFTDNSVNAAVVTDDIHSNDDAVVLICGDWKWITDSRNRSGWQSDEYGSIIRFRLRVITDMLPTISMTYMRSHEKFGNLRVTFQTVSKKDLEKSSPPPLSIGCNDIDKFKENDDGTTLIPSLELDGSLLKFSLWETAVFPKELDYSDVNAEPAWNLFDQTVLSRMKNTGSGNSSDDDVVQFVDLFVINTNTERTRIKIQVVTSC